MVIQVAKGDCKFGTESQNYRELKENCIGFDLEIQKKCNELGRVKEQIKGLEGKKLVIEEEIEGSRKEASLGGNMMDELLGDSKTDVVDDEEESKVDQLMIENKVLECEKSCALKEVEKWKEKCTELESCVVELEGKLSCSGLDCELGKTKEDLDDVDDDVHALKDLRATCSLGATNGETQIEGKLTTPCVGSPQKHSLIEDAETARVQPGAHVKRQLAFPNEGNCDKKIAPSIPAGAKLSPGLLINIADTDDEFDVPEKKETPCMIPTVGFDPTDGFLDQEDTCGSKKIRPLNETPKRKRGPNVFSSDDELEETIPKKRSLKIDNSDNEGDDENGDRPIKQTFTDGDPDKESDDDDDDIPISQVLKISRSHGNNAESRICRRRRLVKSEQRGKKGGQQHTENSPSDQATENVEVDDWEKDSSDSDSDSLGSFIVADDVEDNVPVEDGSDYSSKLDDSSEDNLDFRDIISRLQSRNNPKSNWVLEGDMLSAFGKDPELCMRAVCALYRQQTTEEKLCKESIAQNGRGFSKFDATRGTNLGEFLTGGNPTGDLVKSVGELQEVYPNGVEACHKFAEHYSKQLFEIYMNQEVPFFSCS